MEKRFNRAVDNTAQILTKKNNEKNSSRRCTSEYNPRTQCFVFAGKL